MEFGKYRQRMVPYPCQLVVGAEGPAFLCWGCRDVGLFLTLEFQLFLNVTRNKRTCLQENGIHFALRENRHKTEEQPKYFWECG